MTIEMNNKPIKYFLDEEKDRPFQKLQSPQQTSPDALKLSKHLIIGLQGPNFSKF